LAADVVEKERRLLLATVARSTNARLLNMIEM
jgi:hypothetical protein